MNNTTVKRLIDANEVRSKAIQLEGLDGSGIPYDVMAVPVIFIDDASTVDAVEVVHGRWILADDGDGDVCSVCGTDFCNIIYETGNWNYCPNCGAKMEA